MNQEEEELVEASFELGSLDEAASMMFDEIAEPFEKSAYLDQVYKIIQKTMRNKEWKPMSPQTLVKWEEHLWYIFITSQSTLSEYLPGGDISGWNLASKLWIVLGGLTIMNYCWRPIAPWRKFYNEGGTGLDLPFILKSHMVYVTEPINSLNLNDLLGQLFTLSTRLYDVEYHPELEIWIRMLQMRTFEITYIVTTRELFNAYEFCGPRPKSSTLYGVSDSFVHETCRLFAEFRGCMYRYQMYPRLMVCNLLFLFQIDSHRAGLLFEFQTSDVRKTHE
jgi:hypothetical protein